MLNVNYYFVHYSPNNAPSPPHLFALLSKFLPVFFRRLFCNQKRRGEGEKEEKEKGGKEEREMDHLCQEILNIILMSEQDNSTEFYPQKINSFSVIFLYLFPTFRFLFTVLYKHSSKQDLFVDSSFLFFSSFLPFFPSFFSFFFFCESRR